MERIQGAAYSEQDFQPLAAFIAANTRDRYPAAPILLPGDLAWRLPESAPEQNLRLYWLDERIVGFAWFEPLTGFDFDVQAGLLGARELLNDLFSWAEERRRAMPPAFPRFVLITDMSAWQKEVESPQPADEETGRHLTTTAMESDRERTHWIRSLGYERTDHHAPVYFWDLSEPLPTPEPPAGSLLRSVTAADLEERVAVHRVAWAGSRFNVKRYQEIRARSVYNEELDIVLEDAGIFGSYCICWADPASRIGHFEPVGSRASFRGQGAARAVITEGLHRLKAVGMKYARVSTAGFNTPAQALYESCGFRQVDVERTFIRELV